MTTVLIIDDDPTARAEIRALLPQQWTLLEAFDGLSGLDLVRQRYREIDLVLLDMDMPMEALDGRRVYVLAREIAADLRIIPFTAYPIPAEVLQEWGCPPPLYKPIDEAEARARIAEVLQQPMPGRRTDRVAQLTVELCLELEDLRRGQRQPGGAILYRIAEVLRSGMVQHLSSSVRVTEVCHAPGLRLALETSKWTAIVTELSRAPEVASLAQAHRLPLLCIAYEPSQLRATAPAHTAAVLLANDPALSERLHIALNAIALDESVPHFPPPLLPGTSPRQALPVTLLRQLEDLGVSPRELEVVGLSAQDLSNDEIAQRLDITPTTVNSHWRNIAVKLNLTPRQAQEWLRGQVAADLGTHR